MNQIENQTKVYATKGNRGRNELVLVEAMQSKVILMMPKNQELSKISSKDSRIKFQESRFKNSRIKIKIQDSRFKNQEKTQSR